MAQEIQSNRLEDFFGKSMEISAEEIERLQSTIFPAVTSLWVQAIREIALVSSFFEQTKETLGAKKKALEQEIKKTIEIGREFPDDLFLDFPVLEDFAWLSSEFAVVGLWRCVELFRKNAIEHALGEDAAQGLFSERKFQEILRSQGIDGSRIRCARSVDELRCLNNAIKHQRQVTDSLAEFPRWKEGDELGDLERHYCRLRPLAERYLEDLAKRLNTKFPPPYGVKNAKKDQHG